MIVHPGSHISLAPLPHYLRLCQRAGETHIQPSKSPFPGHCLLLINRTPKQAAEFRAPTQSFGQMEESVCSLSGNLCFRSSLMKNRRPGSLAAAPLIRH